MHWGRGEDDLALEWKTLERNLCTLPGLLGFPGFSGLVMIGSILDIVVYVWGWKDLDVCHGL